MAGVWRGLDLCETACPTCEELPDDPCNPGTALTPHIWFDHDHDGIFEDGPYAMTHDADEEIWTYNLIKTNTDGTSTLGPSCVDGSFATGTVSLWMTLNLGTGTTRYFRSIIWNCWNPSPITLFPQIGIHTAPTYTSSGTSGPPSFTPAGSLGTAGYGSPVSISSGTDPCNNRIFFFEWIVDFHAGVPYMPSVSITRDDASPDP